MGGLGNNWFLNERPGVIQTRRAAIVIGHQVKSNRIKCPFVADETPANSMGRRSLHRFLRQVSNPPPTQPCSSGRAEGTPLTLPFGDAAIHPPGRILDTLSQSPSFAAKPWNVRTVTGKPAHARNIADPAVELFRPHSICWKSQA
jgi:hypothetical protein